MSAFFNRYSQKPGDIYNFSKSTATGFSDCTNRRNRDRVNLCSPLIRDTIKTDVLPERSESTSYVKGGKYDGGNRFSWQGFIS